MNVEDVQRQILRKASRARSVYRINLHYISREDEQQEADKNIHQPIITGLYKRIEELRGIWILNSCRDEWTGTIVGIMLHDTLMGEVIWEGRKSS